MGEIHQTEKTVPLVLNSLSGATVQGAQNTCLKQKLVRPSPTGEAEKRSPEEQGGGRILSTLPISVLNSAPATAGSEPQAPSAPS